MVVWMHHHRLVLNGPPSAVARFTEELRSAGAATVDDGRRPRLIWTTPRASALEALCARHARVIVGVERFASLGDALERLVVHGRETTVLERRGFEVGELDDALPDEGEPLDPAALRAVALEVAALPVRYGPILTATTIDDAVLVGPAVGRLCAAATDAPVARAALRSLAAIGLTVGANASAPACDAELAFERAWRLTQATAFAGQDALWTRPQDADWPEWLMFVLSCAAGLIESCAACAHRAPAGVASLHTEHFATADVMVALQALVLFGEA
jgi:hypothetical protein